MQLIRSLLFNIFLYLGIVIVFIFALPTLVLPNKIVLYFGKFLALYIIVILRIFLNTRVIFHGIDNLKKEKKFFIASAHQSMFETFVLQAPIDFPIFILKKIGSIEIIRNTTTKENLSFFEKVKESINESNRPLLIFPQGTRVKFDDKVPFKKGVGRIYESLNIPCVPVSLDSGKVWPKNSFMKYPGNINISFLEPINPGLEKNIFTKTLEDKIYSEMEKFS